MQGSKFDDAGHAEALNRVGLEANKTGNFSKALHLFLAAHHLVQGDPRFVLSAVR